MKKYTLTIIGICITALLILIQTACSNLLDQKPQGEWVQGDGSGGSFQTDIFTLYAKVRGFSITSGTPALAIHVFRSEDAEKGSTASDGSAHGLMYDDFEYNASNGLIQSYWASNYEMIHIVNSVLDDMKKLVDEGGRLEPNDLINKSEAHFFRAFCYFNLVRAFGEVPLIDFKVENREKAIYPKSPVSKIYELIDKDLVAAAQYLPLKWDKKFIGRLTFGAAKALHARTYMMRNDWGNMQSAALEVIGTGMYDNKTPYDKIFRESGENSSESVFEIQCTATASLPASNDIGSQYAQVQGVRGSSDWNLGWGWNTPTQLLADAFEPNDPRKDETLLYFVKAGENPDNTPANKPWNEKPISQADVVNKYYNKKVYTDPSMRTQYAKSGFWVNIRIIRYSDVLLMAAEAANELNNPDDAIVYLEQVRSRARGNNSSILPKITTKDKAELRTAIRHERRVELGMEWDRFYDLVRWGVAKQVLNAAGKTKYQEKHKYLPLPQAEVDKSNGVLIQNPDYN